MWFLLLAALTAPTALAADLWPQAACDLPSVDLAKVPAETVDACEATCRARPDCGGYTFVSGLNRCTLEHPGAKPFAVQMFSAKLAVVDGQRTTSAAKPDHDHAGKDLETAPRNLPSTAACASACVDTASCVGFVYIQGYRACWLKATDGALTPKRFVCAQRPMEPMVPLVPATPAVEPPSAP